MNKEMLKGTIDLLVLSVLKDNDSYGYQILKIITDRSNNTLEIQEATLYLALKRLEKQEDVESYWGKESQGGKRKYYHLTQQGIEHLELMKNDFSLLSLAVKKFM